MQFGIAHTPEQKNNRWHIVGRCVSNVYLGERFTEIIPHVEIDGRIKQMPPIAADLTVEKIIAYGREFQVLDAGLTALIVLSGDGSRITNYCTLKGAPSECPRG
jgi:hypothetical protein